MRWVLSPTTSTGLADVDALVERAIIASSPRSMTEAIEA
jgi:hypothetical protein